jgi:hypothetical protein
MFKIIFASPPVSVRQSAFSSPHPPFIYNLIIADNASTD